MFFDLWVLPTGRLKENLFLNHGNAVARWPLSRFARLGAGIALVNALAVGSAELRASQRVLEKRPGLLS